MTESDRPGSWGESRPAGEPPEGPPGSGDPGSTGYDNTTGSEATQVVRVDEIDAADLPAAEAESQEWTPPDAETAAPPAQWTPPEPAAEPPAEQWTPPEPASEAAPAEPAPGQPAAEAPRTESAPAEWTPPEPVQHNDPDRTAVYQVQEPVAAESAPVPVPVPVPADSGPRPPDEAPAGPPAPGWAPYAGAAAGGYAAGNYAAGDPNAPRPGETPAYAPVSGPTQTSYGYNDPGYGGAPLTGPGQAAPVEPARPTRIVLPKASARVGTNLLAALVGLVLSIGGLALLVLALPNMGLNELTMKILAVVCVVIIVLPALLLAWAPLVALIPGLVFAAFSFWLLLFDAAPGQLAEFLKQPLDGTNNWALRMITFFGSPSGLGLGLALLFAGIAAIMVRRFTRRSIQDALDAEYAAAEMQPVLRNP